MTRDDIIRKLGTVFRVLEDHNVGVRRNDKGKFMASAPLWFVPVAWHAVHSSLVSLYGACGGATSLRKSPPMVVGDWAIISTGPFIS